MALYYIYSTKLVSMIDSESPRKNLWKNLKTQKTKLSGVDQANNSPININTNYSEPPRSFALDKHLVTNRNHVDLELQFAEVQKQLNFGQEQSKQYYQPLVNSKNLYVPVPTMQPIENQSSRLRRLSLGQESIVEQIVDFKNPNNLEIGDFQQEQQPMIMSLGSQSNPVIRMLKLSKVKEDLQKLEASRLEIVKYLKQEKQKYSQAFEKTFHEMLTYVIFFYSEKSSQDLESDNERSSLLMSGNYRKSIGQEDTPHFAKLLKSKKSLQRSKEEKHKSQDEISFEEHIQKLQQELFKAKIQNQGLEDELLRFKKENQEMNEAIFDYEQKIAQFQLEVSKKVDEIVEKKISQLQKNKYNEQAESDRQYYLGQILSLEKQIEILEKNSYNQQEYLELNEIGQQLEKKSEFLNQRELYLINREKELSQLEVELNSQKLEMEKRIKGLQSREIQLRSWQSKLQQKQVELALKQKQISSKSFHVDRESSVFEKNGFNHRRKESEDQHYEHSADFKVKNVPSFKNNDLTGNRYINEWQQKSSLATLQGDRNLNRPGQKSENKLKIEAYLKDNVSKEKQPIKYQKSFNSYSRPSKINNTSSSSYSSKSKQQDKSRLQDLGTKLENLRNQIRKEIRDTE